MARANYSAESIFAAIVGLTAGWAAFIPPSGAAGHRSTSHQLAPNGVVENRRSKYSASLPCNSRSRRHARRHLARETTAKAQAAAEAAQHRQEQQEAALATQRRQEAEAAAQTAQHRQEQQEAALATQRRQEAEAAAQVAKRRQEAAAQTAQGRQEQQEAALATQRRQEAEAAAQVAKRHQEAEAAAQAAQRLLTTEMDLARQALKRIETRAARYVTPPCQSTEPTVQFAEDRQELQRSRTQGSTVVTANAPTSGGPLTVAEANALSPDTKLIFSKKSSYAYPPSLVDGQIVYFATSNPIPIMDTTSNRPIPPIKVRWSSRSTYWVHAEDLSRFVCAVPASVRTTGSEVSHTKGSMARQDRMGSQRGDIVATDRIPPRGDKQIKSVGRY
jgi:chemotaxis protein histidine kinase CheA